MHCLIVELCIYVFICFCVNFIKNSVCLRSNEKSSIIHRLWQGAFDKGGFFHTTFWQCVEKDQIGMMEHIGETPSGIHKFDKLKWSCLHTIGYCIDPYLITGIVTSQHLNTLKKLFLQQFKDLLNFSHGGNLPIHLACQMNNVLILKIIIEVANEKLSQKQFNEMLNQVKKDKYWNCTPLMIAIKNNSIDCVKLLCRYDCVVDGIFKHKSRYPSYNSFEFACYYNNVDILKMLYYLCDLKQLDSKEYLAYLKKLASYGSSKRYLQSKCIEFLDDFSSNPMLKPTQLTTVSNGINTMSNSDKHYMQFVCCWNHVLAPPTVSTPEKCDVCTEKSTSRWECTICAIQGDSNRNLRNICEKCAIATSVWSAVVYGTTNGNDDDDLQSILPNFINADSVNRVECRLYATCACCF